MRSILASAAIVLAFAPAAFAQQNPPPTYEQVVVRSWKNTHDKILAMAKEIHAGRAGSTGGIFMDATKVPLEIIQKHIPHVYKTCLHRHIDISKTPLEVAPGSHTWLGGLEVDIRSTRIKDKFEV